MARNGTARKIAPRLANGESRDRLYNGLPHEIKTGLKRIARMENKSVSWVLEEVIIRYFKLRRPLYVTDEPGRLLPMKRAVTR